jgi:hypothetical protein
MKSKGKGKGHPITGHEGPEGKQRYRCILSLTLALDGGGERDVPTALSLQKTQYPLHSTLGWPKVRSGRARKTSPRHRDSIPGPSSP